MRRTLLSSWLLVIASAPLLAQQGPPVLQRRPPADPAQSPPVLSQPEQRPPEPAPPAPVTSQPAPDYPNNGPAAPTTNVPSSPAPYNMIVSGTLFIVRLDDSLDTAKLSQGKHFKAKLAEDLLGPSGTVLIPRGRKIKGHVSDSARGMHARLLLSFDEIESPHGWIPLIATVTGVPGEHAVDKVSEEGEIERRTMSKRRAIESAAVGAAVGATAGAAAGGGKGAGIGAGAGAGLGALTGVLTDRNMRLEKGQQLEVRLDRDMRVPER
jgi:hypothetical protein